MIQAKKPDDEHVARMWREYKRDTTDCVARNRLLELYYPIVKRYAAHLRSTLPVSSPLEYGDLLAPGTFGLIDAMERFDLHRGVKFETFCGRRIYGEMVDELRRVDYVPRNTRMHAAKIAKASEALNERLDRPPSHDEIRDELGVSEETYRCMMRAARIRSLVSLDGVLVANTDGGQDVTREATLQNRRVEDPSREAEKTDLMRLVTRGLSGNERIVITLYYYGGLTMREIGESLGVCESRISQVRARCIVKMKERLAGRENEFYVS